MLYNFVVLRKSQKHQKSITPKSQNCLEQDFFVLIGINYFIQISAVRLQIKAGQTNGLGQFIQANPVSVFSAINML